MFKCLHVKHLLFLSEFSETSIFLWQTFGKSSDIKFHENPSSGAELFHVHNHRQMDRWTDVTKLIVALHNF
jgi:hypothetical protein